jgi:hypothetical protein
MCIVFTWNFKNLEKEIFGMGRYKFTPFFRVNLESYYGLLLCFIFCYLSLLYMKQNWNCWHSRRRLILWRGSLRTQQTSKRHVGFERNNEEHHQIDYRWASGIRSSRIFDMLFVTEDTGVQAEVLKMWNGSEDHLCVTLRWHS